MKYIFTKTAVLAGMICIIMAGCKKEKYVPDPGFVGSNHIMLKIDGSEKLVYTPEKHQLSFNRAERQYRVFNDNMSSYYTLTCSEIPAAKGQKIKCDLKFSEGTSSFHREGLTFQVEKTDGDGTVWLWCNDKNIGVSVRTLE